MKTIITSMLLLITISLTASIKVEGYVLNAPHTQIEVYEYTSNTKKLVENKKTLFSSYKVKLEENKFYVVVFQYKDKFKTLRINTKTKAKIIIDVDFSTTTSAYINYVNGKYKYLIHK